MSYDFSFNKKTLTFLMGGCVFVSILLFIAGVLVGVNWKTETATITTPPVAGGQQAAAQPPTPSPPPPAAPAPAPKDPALRADAMIPKAPNPDEVVQSAAPPPVRQSHRIFGGVDNRREVTTTPPPEGDDSGLKIISQAEPPATESDEKAGFSVQVAVFGRESDANQLARQLQSKGYAPLVLTANDDDDRVWYAVRVGAYTNQADARQAATDFTKQEKILTMVCPLDTLRCVETYAQDRKR